MHTINFVVDTPYGQYTDALIWTEDAYESGVANGSITDASNQQLMANRVNAWILTVTAPTIIGLTDQSLVVGQALPPLNYAVSAPVSGTTPYSVTGASDNPQLVQVSDLTITQPDANGNGTLTITLETGQIGTAQVTLTVTDNRGAIGMAVSRITVSAQGD
jgi:hypothetical protein